MTSISKTCNALIHTCRKCDQEFASTDILVCPECGEDRGRCTKSPIAGRNRCRWHGGKSPRGVDHYNYKGRGYSKHLPTRMMEQYRLAFEDPDILNMTQSISLLEARKVDLVNKSSETPPYVMWHKLRQSFDKYIKYRDMGNARKASEALFELEKIIIGGLVDSQVWKEIMDIEEQQRKLRTTELKRRELASTVITEKQFETLMGFIINSINTRVKDPDTKMAILGDLAQLNV